MNILVARLQSQIHLRADKTGVWCCGVFGGVYTEASTSLMRTYVIFITSPSGEASPSHCICVVVIRQYFF